MPGKATRVTHIAAHPGLQDNPDNQHPDHPLGIDRGSAPATVERAEALAPIVDPQQVLGWNVIVEVEGVEQSVLVAAVVTYHLDALRSLACRIRPQLRIAVQRFSTE